MSRGFYIPLELVLLYSKDANYTFVTVTQMKLLTLHLCHRRSGSWPLAYNLVTGSQTDSLRLLVPPLTSYWNLANCVTSSVSLSFLAYKQGNSAAALL